MILIILNIYPKVGLLDQIIVVFSILVGIFKQFSVVAVPFHIPSKRIIFHILTTLILSWDRTETQIGQQWGKGTPLPLGTN